ncbi:MAG: GNAT family N-acetyltransferase [Proteobacteria bacterium]|nr:GNAT family N-acetyltransferase [Pseudomonadota bacterium]
MGEYIIRDWRIEDAPSIARYANNRKIWLNLRDGFPHPYSLKDAKDFISQAMAIKPASVFAIATKTEAIGSIGFFPGKDVHRFTAEIGYWLAEPFWGKGIVTEAVKRISSYAIHDMKLHRISAEPYATNKASARVLEKAGFTYEGILRASAFKDGEIIDQVIYSLTRIR